jgi:hypothetical protein
MKTTSEYKNVCTALLGCIKVLLEITWIIFLIVVEMVMNIVWLAGVVLYLPSLGYSIKLCTILRQGKLKVTRWGIKDVRCIFGYHDYKDVGIKKFIDFDKEGVPETTYGECCRPHCKHRGVISVQNRLQGENYF